MLRHQAGARLIGQYDANNTYQYIINREETAALLAGEGDYRARRNAWPDSLNRPVQRQGKATEAARHVLEEDARDAQAFVDRWRPRVEAMANARHAKMLQLMLGEMLEQKRFFEQALAGRTDLLGRRGAQLGPSHGDVLPSRWIE